MATWVDFLSLVLTVAVCGGAVYGVLYVVKAFSESVQSTKDRLKAKGLELSDKGMSVKTKKRMDWEDYVTATQKGIVDIAGASSFGRSDHSTSTPLLRPSAADNHHSGSSHGEEKKKRVVFGSKKS